MRMREHEGKAADPFRRQRIVTVLAALAVLFGSLWTARALTRPLVPVFEARERPVLILDPGHGGIDGGAIAYNGVKESDLNLSIALKLRDLADFCGVETAMTRSDDSRRTDLLHYSEHEDLVWRVEQINAVPDGLLISIHQNCFPTSQPSGAQVLYARDAESRRLGELTQAAIVSALQPNNRRVAGPADEKLYITANAACPAILVECGFLSNFDDLRRLSDEGYQKSFAAVLLSAYLQYTAQEA